MRRRHPKKEIEKALRVAESLGWTVTVTSRGHRWGEIRCAHGGRDGCRKSVWSTPRVPASHAKELIAYIESCRHGRTVEGGGAE